MSISRRNNTHRQPADTMELTDQHAERLRELFMQTDVGGFARTVAPYFQERDEMWQGSRIEYTEDEGRDFPHPGDIMHELFQYGIKLAVQMRQGVRTAPAEVVTPDGIVLEYDLDPERLTIRLADEHEIEAEVHTYAEDVEHAFVF